MKKLWRFPMMVLVGLVIAAMLLTLPTVSIIWAVHHFAISKGP